MEDLAHGEREDLEALDEGLVVRVVDVDDHDPDGLSVAAGGCTAVGWLPPQYEDRYLTNHLPGEAVIRGACGRS